MTYEEIFIQIISEVSGKPKQEISNLLSAFQQTHPGDKWDKIIPEHKADKLCNDLRKETPGILKWLHNGAMRVTGQ